MRKIYQRAMAVALAGTTLLGAGLWHKSHREAPDAKKTVSQNADALPAGVSEATLADIRSSLEKQEYHISYDEQKKKLQSPNRRNNIRAYYEPGKLTVQTRVDTTGEGFKMELVNEGVFADGQLLYTPEAHAKAQHHDNKVLISHDAFTEEFINNEDGVRQNFIIENAPEGTRQLQVKMTAKGLKVEQSSGNELRFYSEAADGQTRNELVYSDLKCWDANKKPLSASLAYVDNRVQISVDVAGAAYPVTIDPIIANGTPQNANKVLEVNQSYMWLGFSVASAGDVNGDGYSDVIVGAPHYDLGEDNEGGAFVYKGGAFVLTATAVTFQSNQKDAQMGYSVASAGDFNGDGFSDVLVGIPYYDDDKIDQGLAKLYLGSDKFFTDPITSYALGQNDHAGALVGISVATAGDVNGDGLSDLLIGASQDSNGESKEGTVGLFYGNLNANPFSSGTLIQINQPNAQFGYSLAPAGDVDADGYSDIIIGARWYTNGQGQDAEGAAFIYRGGSNGLQGNPTIIEGNQYNAAMGNKVSSAGDVNGDGYSDVLISAYLFDTGIQNQKDHGIVNLYLGSSNGITSQQQPSRTFYGKDNDHMGSSIACAGDVNGDGYSDILLGAEYYDNGQFNEGGVFVYYGSKGNVGIVGDPVATMESNQADGWFGTAVASAGDVNGDGYSDILVGCYAFDNGQKDEGHVFVYHGGAEGIGAKGAVTLSGTVSGAKMGYSVASAGDVNSDGFDDVIMGAPEFDFNGTTGGIAILYYGSINGIVLGNQVTLGKNQLDSHFGESVAGAGDINGDGYSDVLVGAPKYDNGQTDEGAAYVFFGTTVGLGLQGGKVLEAQQDSALMGTSVSSAGDVNKDGFSDILVGIPYYDKGEKNEGIVQLYLGSQNGVSAVSFTVLESNQIGAAFGISTALAGDVNADGYSDVLIGAHMFDNGQVNEGAAFLYYGSPNSLQINSPEILESNQSGSMMGYAVAGAGDINNDGASDIMVGARLYSNGETYEGAVFIYKGSVLSTPVLQNGAPQIIESNQIDARLGHALSTAGDVNGDGYSDVILAAYLFDNGQTNEGAVFIHHGSANGVNPVAAKTIEGNQIEAQMGFAVNAAGDHNGDGYGDIIIGARFYDNGQANEGAVFIHNGSPTGISQTANAIIESNQGEAWMGNAVASAGDVNGDGYSDIVVGVFTYDNGQNDEGIVVIYNGKPDAPGATAKVATLTAVTGASAGTSVSIVGDLDGDGLDDIAVGAPNYDDGYADQGALFIHYGDATTGTAFQILWKGTGNNAKFGSAVSGAGDVNGDGLDDIIVSAPGATSGANVGGVYVIFGAPKNAGAGIPVELFGGGNSGFGAAVSGAGDINRDGFDDIIIGVPNANKPNAPGTGMVYIYLGAGIGLNLNPTGVNSGLPNTHIGNSLSSADTNGDGYSDIIVGANQASIGGQNGEGAVFIWRGSASGIATDAIFNNLLELNQPNAGMGISVAGAGDVNGDGYGDIVVGSDKYDNGQNDEGRATVFYGSSVGCSSASKTDLEINYAGAYFGRSVGGSTDVNADGYDDVIVGAPFYGNGSSNEGGAWVFYGSPDGVIVTSSFSAESNQLLAHMGASVSGGGDLNGDGYGDFVVGIPDYTQSGTVNSGSCWAYFGNNGNHGNLWQNKRNNLRLYNSNLSSPMSYQQATNVSFGLGLTGTSFTGRNNGRLMWDFATPGQKFSCVAGNPKDYPITTSTKTDNGQMAFYSLPPYEFKELVAKPVGSAFRIRGRVKYELTTALTGQRYSPWRYSSKQVIYIQPLTVPQEASNELFVPQQSLENAELDKLVTVYPNPVSDRLFIQSTNMDQVSSVQLISANGATALTSAKPQSEVDVKHLPAGSYILVINRKDGSKTSHRVLIRK